MAHFQGNDDLCHPSLDGLQVHIISVWQELKLNTDLRFGLTRARSGIVTSFMLVMPLMQPSMLFPFDTEATVHSYRPCFPPGVGLYSAGKDRIGQSVKNNCFFSAVSDWVTLLFNSRMIYLFVCLFVGFLFCLFPYLNKEPFLVVFIMSDQSKLELRFCFSNCIYTCPGNAPVALHVICSPSLVYFSFGFEHALKKAKVVVCSACFPSLYLSVVHIAANVLNILEMPPTILWQEQRL